jgi:hypothetical protein
MVGQMIGDELLVEEGKDQEHKAEQKAQQEAKTSGDDSEQVSRHQDHASRH